MSNSHPGSRRPLEPTLLLGLLVVLAGHTAFGLLAAWVLSGDTQAFDEAAIELLRPAGGRPAWLDERVRDVSALGSDVLLVGLTLAATGALALRGRRREAILVLVLTLGGFAISLGLKGFFDRPRPEVAAHLSHVESSSFPSGHAMMAAVVYPTLGALVAGLLTRRRDRLHVLLWAVGIALAVGLSRVYLGVHYPTDVLAGWMAGLVWATLCWTIERRAAR